MKSLKRPKDQELYINPFHGRDNAEDDMDDWGYEGPVLGPFSGIHFTYMTVFKLMIDGDWKADIEFEGDLFHYDGKYYGDWSIVTKQLIDQYPSWKVRLEKPNPEKFKLKSEIQKCRNVSLV